MKKGSSCPENFRKAGKSRFGCGEKCSISPTVVRRCIMFSGNVSTRVKKCSITVGEPCVASEKISSPLSNDLFLFFCSEEEKRAHRRRRRSSSRNRGNSSSPGSSSSSGSRSRKRRQQQKQKHLCFAEENVARFWVKKGRKV